MGPIIVKSEVKHQQGGQDIRPECFWDISGTPSDELKALTCARCTFVGLPRTLRLHQLLGCCSGTVDTSNLKNSDQSTQESLKKYILKTPHSNSVEKMPIADGNGVKFNASSDGICDLCSFCAPLRTLRLHQLLSCCAVVLKEDKSKPFVEKQDNLLCDKKNVLKCEICDYTCKFLSTLKRHSVVHTKEKPFSCETCNYKCSDLRKLKTHYFTHTGEKPFSCDLCNYKCRQSSSLKRHTFIHTGEKPFSCNVCSYKSNNSSRLKQHNLTHTGEKLYSCKLCSYKCNQLSQLKTHNLRHTKEKPYSCNLCSYECGEPGTLRRHKLRHKAKKVF